MMSGQVRRLTLLKQHNSSTNSLQFICHSRFAGSHEAAIPPGSCCEQEREVLAGLALADQKFSSIFTHLIFRFFRTA
jgi:hypothetical protein